MHNRYILRDSDAGITFLSHVEFQFIREGGQHSHAELQILAILHGATDMAIGTNVMRIEAGDMVVLPARVGHTVPAVANRREVQLLDLRIDTQHRGELARTVDEGTWPTLTHASPHELGRIAAALGEGATLDGTAQRAAIHRAAWSLLTLLASSSASTGTERIDRRIATAEQFMLRNLTKPISVEQIATSCAISVSQLNRLYRGSGLAAPAQRLRTMRIDRARELLVTSLFTVKEIAFACGFVCPNHFCRLFKQDVGLTPGDYRDREGARIAHPLSGEALKDKALNGGALKRTGSSSRGSRTSARPAPVPRR